MSDMTIIKEDDLIESVADALQFISYYHPMDYIRALGEAYEAEQGPAAKDAIAQILTNSRMCAEGHRPICQDTGIVNVFVKWGQNCRLESAKSLQEVVDEGVRRAYNHDENKLRASILADPAFTRRNTRDNTPCVLSVEMVPGNMVGIDVAAKGVDLDNLTKEEVESWQHGDRLLLSGKMLTGRDAAHKRIKDMLEAGEQLPVSFEGRAIYYVGPVDPVMGEVVGPAGPTTATRMDKFTEMMLDLGLLAMIGKAERGADAVDVISRFKTAYLMATGGAAYLVARAIKEAKVVAFEELGMEAIYEFTVENMPVTVAVDAQGNNVHTLAPAQWKKRIAEEKLLEKS